MQKIEDAELAGKGVLAGLESKDPFSSGLYFVNTTKEDIEELGTFVNSIYQKVIDKHQRQVTRNAITMLKGAMFALGTKDMGNPEWKEHCASSLREIFHEWGNGDMRSDFTLFYRGEGVSLTDSEKDTFNGFHKHYKYLSGIDHHNAAMIMNNLRSILDDDSLKLEDCYKDDVFLDRVKDFLRFLKTIKSLSEDEKS